MKIIANKDKIENIIQMKNIFFYLFILNFNTCNYTLAYVTNIVTITGMAIEIIAVCQYMHTIVHLNSCVRFVYLEIQLLN